MAQKTIEQLEKELAEATAMIAEKDAAITAKGEEVEELRKIAVDAGAPTPVEGSYKASYKDPSGKSVTKTVKFKDGHRHLYIGGHRVETESVIAIANGKEAGKKVLERNPAISTINQEIAEKFLTSLVKMKYAYLK